MRISDWSSDVCSSDLAMLREKGISKRDLTREQFMEHAWEWKKKYGGIILEQLKKLGASCDWERKRFTMDPRTEARRVEKECVSTCRSRCATYHEKKKRHQQIKK